MAADNGEANTQDTSVSNMVTTLISNGVTLGVFFIAFLILRPKFKRIYQPRSFLPTVPEQERTEPQAVSPISWLVQLWHKKDSRILEEAGLDGYFFLRYIRVSFLITVVGIILLYPILLPVNATGKGDAAGLNLLSFTNILSPQQSNRFYAHVFLGWFFFGFCLFMIYREFVYFISIRQAVLTSPAYSTRLSSRVVLIASLPEDYQDENELRKLFRGVHTVYVSRNFKKIEKKVAEREKLAGKLEGAENKMIKMAIKNKLKAENKGKTPKDLSFQDGNISTFVLEKKRPTHRLKFLIGEKVDTINYSRKEVGKLNQEIEEMQAHLDENEKLNSAFVLFNSQEEAQIAYQLLAHNKALHAAPRYTGISPDEVIWANLRIKWWERVTKAMVVKVFLTALVILWAIPVAVVGSFSNIKSLTGLVPFLGFLNNLPSQLQGLVSGLLPTILMAVLMMLLPIIIRQCAKQAGCPTTTQVEYYTQNAFFAFQFVNVFLITTFASSAAATVKAISDDPGSAMTMLSGNLPKSSNFFVSYIMLQALSFPGGALLQIVALILFKLLGTLLDNTPRKIWTRYNILGSTSWGTVFPVYTLLIVVSIAYAVVSPIILVFAAVGFALIYLVFLNNLVYCEVPADGRGIYYSRALRQTLLGVYFGQIFLLALFIMAKAWGPLALQVVFLVFTVFFHRVMLKAFNPLLDAVPMNLMRECTVGSTEKQRLLDGSVEKQRLLDAPPRLSGDVFSDAQAYPDGQADISVAPSHLDVPQEHPILSHEKEGQETDTEKIATTTNTYTSYDGGEDPHYKPPAHQSQILQFLSPYEQLAPRHLQKTFLTPYFHEPVAPLSAEEEKTAYLHPATSAPGPLIWVAQDPYGLSTVEVEETEAAGVEATDKGAWYKIEEVNKKGKKKEVIEFSELSHIPIWSTPVEY
ncbi:hypothetical protein CJU90_4880 [Yarrowia sp. C11]|nr:hypothetical protein CJU90_4880 [Yarrowia sp. C11]